MMALGRLRGRLIGYPWPVPLLIVGQALLATGTGVVFPFLSLYATSAFGADVATAGVVGSAYFAAGIPAAPIAGVVADRVGRRWVLVTAVLGYASAVAVMAAAPSLAVLVGAALVAGFAVASVHTVNAAVVADAVPAERRGQAYGLVYQALGLGWFLGPLVAAPFLFAGAYRVAFAVVAAAIALAGTLYALRLPETRPRPVPGTPEPAAGSGRTSGTGGRRRWWNDPRLLAYAALQMLTIGSYLQLFMIFPVDAAGRLGVGPGSWAVILSINGLLILAGQGVVSRAVARFRKPAAVAGGVLLWSVGFVILALPIPLLVVAVALVILTAGEMIVFPLQPAVVADLSPPEERGRYQGVLSFGTAVGNAIAPLVAGAAVAAIGGAWWALLAAGLVGLSAGYAAFGRIVRPSVPGPTAPGQSPDQES